MEKFAIGVVMLVLLLATPMIARWWSTRHVIRIYFGGGRRQSGAWEGRSVRPWICTTCKGVGWLR